MNKLVIAALCVVCVFASPVVKRQANGTDDAQVLGSQPDGASGSPPDEAPSADSPPSPPAPRPPSGGKSSEGPTARKASSNGGGATSYALPDGAELLLPSIRSTFSCDGRHYGYYADTDNECRIFHVCLPVEAEDGHQSTLIYSFFCGNRTVFDQEDLVCAHEEDAFPCDQAASVYDSVNSRFGVTDKPSARQQAQRSVPSPDDAPALLSEGADQSEEETKQEAASPAAKAEAASAKSETSAKAEVAKPKDSAKTEVAKPKGSSKRAAPKAASNGIRKNGAATR